MLFKKGLVKSILTEFKLKSMSMIWFTQHAHINILYDNYFENLEKSIFSIYTENWKSVSVWLRYIPKLQNPYRYFFGIYRNFKIHTDIFSVYTETSKSIPIFFRYIPKPQKPYRYFSVYTVPKNTGIFRYRYGICATLIFLI